MNLIPSLQSGLTALLVPFAVAAHGAAYEIGEEFASEAFWKSDAVLFVRKHVENGFQFTSDQRDGVSSRMEGGVTCFGLPVYETRLSFAPGGIARVEVMLYEAGGTETMREMAGTDGKKFFRRERVEKEMTRAEFGAALKTLRSKLSGKGKVPAAKDDGVRKDTSTFQKIQVWPRTDLPTQAALVWNYVQRGKDTSTFAPGFIRLAVDGPLRLASLGRSAAGAAKKSASGAMKIADNVVRDPRGDVFIDNLPMVDQGQKGYCSVATAERVLRYYGVDVDEHELATAAGTSAENGTSTRAMKQSVEAIGRKYKLATMICYGDFEKSAEQRIAGLGDEVRAYNKAAKKLKKPAITDDMYIRHEGNVTYYDPNAVDKAMDVEVRMQMKVNGAQKSKFTKFQKDIHDQVAKGIPLFWGVTLGIYPEPDVPQAGGGHMRLIIGYNDKKKEILYSDSWGAGHELKRMPIDWAWTISHCLMYMKPLGK